MIEDNSKPVSTPIAELAKTATKGTASIFFAQASGGVVSLVGMVFLARLLGPNEFGLIAVVMILPSLVMLFQDWAVSHAITRHVAAYRAQGNEGKARDVIIVGAIFELLTGASLSIISFVLSEYFATAILFDQNLTPLIRLASWSVFGAGMFLASKSILVGLYKMSRFSILLVLAPFFQSVLPAILVVLGGGLVGAIVGKTLGSLMIGFVGLLALLRIRGENRIEEKEESTSFVTTLKELLSYGFLIYLSTIVGGALPQILYTIAAQQLNVAILSNYSVALGLSGLMLFVSEPIMTVIFPTFSKLDGQTQREDLGTIYVLGTKYTSFLVLFVASLLIVLSEPLVSILYGAGYEMVPYLLTLSLGIFFLAPFGSQVVGSLLRGQGETRVYFGMHIALLSIGSLLGLVLTPIFGAGGLIVANIIAFTTAIAIGNLWVDREYGFRVQMRDSVKLLVSAVVSILMGILSLSAFRSLGLIPTSFIALIVFLITNVLIFGILQPFTVKDFENARLLISSLGKLKQPITFLLGIYEFVSKRGKSSIKSECFDDEERLDITKRMKPNGVQTILDVGCGEGKLTSLFFQEALTVGLDTSMNVLLRAPSDCVQGSGTNLPFSDKSFDLVVCTEMLEHLDMISYRETILELERASRKWILVSVPLSEELDEGRVFCDHCGASFNLWGHKQSFSQNQVLRMFENFDPVKIRRTGHYVDGSETLNQLLARAKTNMVESIGVCPSCRLESSFKISKIPPINFILKLNGAIRILKKKIGLSKPIWIIVLYKRKS